MTPSFPAVLKDGPDGAKMLWKQMHEWSGRNGYCWWSQKRMAEEMGWSLRKVNGLISYLQLKVGLIEVTRQGPGRSAHYKPLFQTEPDFKAKQCRPRTKQLRLFSLSETRTDTHQDTQPVCVSLSLSSEIEKVKCIPHQQTGPEQEGGGAHHPRSSSTSKPQRKPMATENSPKPVDSCPVETVSTEEYRAFAVHCAEVGLEVPSRTCAVAVKRKYVGTINGSPAWLQLPCMAGQKTAYLWTHLEREQVLMELQRRCVTLPKLPPREEQRARVDSQMKQWLAERKQRRESA